MIMNERAKSEHSASGSAKSVLLELQVEQHHHDENYHREIARLSMHQRLNHMALHFAKYAGKIAVAKSTKDAVSVYVDVLIIVLSTTNILNEYIWELLPHAGQEYPGLVALGRFIAHHETDKTSDIAELLRETVISSGAIAAACEKIDHLEEVSYRSDIKRELGRLAALALATIASHGDDPAAAVRERLAGVKGRLKLHGRI